MKPFFLFSLLIALLSGAHVAAQTGVLGKDWTLEHPSPTAENLEAVAANGAVSMVAVGGHGAILTASGVSGVSSWTRNVSTTTADLWDVVWTGVQYVAVGSNDTVLTATGALGPSGLTWVSHSIGATSTDQLNSVAANGTKLVAVGVTSTGVGVALFSSNSGTSWSRTVVAGTTSLKGVTFVNNQMYAVMDGFILTSSNGTTWARITALPATTVTSIAYATPLGADVALSVTGSKNWVADNLGATVLGSAPANLAMSWVGDELAGVTRTGELWHSNNGVLWQNLINAASATPAYVFNAVTKFGSTYIAVGDSGVIQSYDVGGAWTPQTSAGTSLGTNGVAWNQATDSTSLYVAVGWGMSWTSPDAVTWTEHVLTTTTQTQNMLSVIWTGTYFVAVGNGLWVSTDGITWTLKLPAPMADTAPSIYAVSWLNGTPYALGYNSTSHQVMISQGDNTGFGWSNFVPVAGASWAMLGLAKNDSGLFVAVGWGGRVLTTTKPATGPWAQVIVPLAAGEDFTDVMWTNDTERQVKQFTAVTSKGGIWTSINGTTWTKRKTAAHALWCITRTAHPRTGDAVADLDNQFIAAGDHGLLVTSFNGIEWQEADMGTSQYINQILWAPTTIPQLVAAGGHGTFLVSNGTPPVQTSVSFGQATDTITEGGTVPSATTTITVNLSNALSVAATIPLVFTGGTAPATAFRHSANAVTFNAGDLTKTFTITAVNDGFVHGDKTVKISFGQPAADVSTSKGTNPTEMVTIHDANLVPVMSATVTTSTVTDAASALVLKGAAVTFNSTVTQGTGTITRQWRRDGINLAGATANSLLLSGVTLAQAGAYTVAGKNTAGTGVSPAVGLAVVDGTPQFITAKSGDSITLTAGAEGTGLAYLWSYSGGPLSGNTSKTFVINNVQTANNGVYSCAVSIGAGTPLNIGNITVTVVSGLPALTGSLTLPAGAVALSYSFTPSVAVGATAYRWTITGLPPGLVYDRVTGAISGTPTRGGTYHVTVVASNVFGSSTFVSPLVVAPLTSSVVGKYVAIVAGDNAVNQGLGGRLDVTTTSTGSFTGTLTAATTIAPAVPNGSSSFIGTLSGVSGLDRTGTVVLSAGTVTFTISGTNGSVSGSVGSASVTGWHQTATSPRTGYYTCAFSPTDPTQISGYGLLTVASAGTVNLTSVIATGSGAKLTSSTITGPNGEIPVYVPLSTPTYVNIGSVRGNLTLAVNGVAPAYATNTFSGSSLTAVQIIAPATLPAGSTNLAADGGRYTAPAKGHLVMGLQPILVAGVATPNAKLAFLGGDLATDTRDPDDQFIVTAAGVPTAASPNPAQTFLNNFVPATGEFSGGFWLFDAAKAGLGDPSREALFNGVIIRTGGSAVLAGKGFFYLTPLPVVPGLLLGSVDLTPYP